MTSRPVSVPSTGSPSRAPSRRRPSRGSTSLTRSITPCCATKPAGQHRRHPPRRPAPAARPTLSRSPLTSASPASRPWRNQAGRWKLSLLPHPHRPRCYRSALPCYSDRDHPGARVNQKSVQEVSRLRSLETKRGLPRRRLLVLRGPEAGAVAFLLTHIGALFCLPVVPRASKVINLGLGVRPNDQIGGAMRLRFGLCAVPLGRRGSGWSAWGCGF